MTTPTGAEAAAAAAARTKGGCFDFAIRPTGVAPPIREPFVIAGRVSFSCLCNTAWFVFGHFYLVPYFKLWGLAISFLYWPLFHFIWDGLTCNNFGDNIVRLRRAGWKDHHTLAVMLFNLAGACSMGYMALEIAKPENFTASQIYDSFTSWWFLCQVLINLAAAEVFFTLGHGCMHTVEPLTQYHVMHHCSKNPSWNTNLLFHPIDLALEFGGPAAALLALHFLVWRNDVLLAVTFTVFQMWYAWDHDAYMGFYHTQHHVKNDSMYTIYIKALANPKHNLLPGKMGKLFRLSSSKTDD